MADNTIEVEGIAEQIKQLEKMMTTNPRLREGIQSCVRKVLKEVQKQLSADADTGLQMKSDPRRAYKAVRYAVYKRLLGGQVNILQRRRAGQPGNYQKPRKGVTGAGGNRWRRSERTKAIEGYEGADRGFILRFLNAGTEDRMITSYTDKNGERHTLRSGGTANIKTHGLGGNRGSIAARNWFGQASQKELMAMSADLQSLIDKVIDTTIF